MRRKVQYRVKEYPIEEWEKFRRQYSKNEWSEINATVGFGEAIQNRDLTRAAEIASACKEGNVDNLKEMRLKVILDHDLGY